MQNLYYATKNKGKIESLQQAFAGQEITVLPVNLELPEPRSDDLQRIATEKVRYAFSQVQAPVVALDAGFFIPSLNGFPKAFVNFALETIGLEGILRLLEGKDRGCDIRECIAYKDQSREEYFHSAVHGTLAPFPRGQMASHLWSPMATLFIPEGYSKTFAEMSLDEYGAWRVSLRDEQWSSKLFAHWFAEQKQTQHYSVETTKPKDL